MRVPDPLVRGLFEPLWDRFQRSERLRHLKTLRRTQFDSPQAVRARQDLDLARLVAHAARTSPFYEKRFAAAGIDPGRVRGIADLRGLPPLTKSDVRSGLDELLSRAFERKNLILSKTGGSTGVALQVYCDEKCRQLRNAAALRSDEWSGWRLGQPMAAVWGNPPRPITFKNKVRLLLKDRVIYLDTMRINARTIEAFLADWRKLSPGLLFGHAHSLFILAEALLEMNRSIRPSGVVATSMMLLEPERQVMERAFGVKITNRYGCEEVSLIACECEEHAGLHLNSDHNIVEFLRDDGSPCAPGEDGRIVVTELINFGMPMLRYEVGDRGAPSDRICSCGRGLPLMESLSGRIADFLVSQSGDKVAGISIIENTLTRIPGIRQLQIIQDQPLHLRVHLVRGKEYEDASGEALAASLHSILGERFDVDLRLVERIPQESNGKIRFTICQI